jgi:hypothetical protein
MENPNAEPQHERLQELAAKSWNLELIISGAAIFLVSYLPESIDQLLQYYLDNLVLDEDFKKITLPLLAYSFMKVVAWMLILTFVLHFALRAFWVGLVGLQAAYPEGIQYERIPRVSDFTRQLYKRSFGSLSEYILRLDKISNQVFSLAFAIALMAIGISLIYLVYFSLETFLPLIAGPEWGKFGAVAGGLFLAFSALLPAFAQMLVKKPERLDKHPRTRRVVEWIIAESPSFMLPIVYRPTQMVTLAFMSNLSSKRLYLNMGLITLIILGGVMYCFLETSFDLRKYYGTNSRSYFAQQKNAYSQIPGEYDDQRPEGAYLPLVTIEKEVVDGPFLKVFVRYPKYLDATLAAFCPPAVWPDSLSRPQKAALSDSVHIECLSRFFRVYVNDSLFQQQEWLFYEKTTRKIPGLVTYLPTTNFKNGKNILKVMAPAEGKPDSLRLFESVPFWFSKDK